MPIKQRPVIRDRVYHAIDSERDYQDERWGATLSSNRPATAHLRGGQRSVDEFILYIAAYADQLKAIGGISDDLTYKLDHVRKVAALGIACMEQHGAPHRMPKLATPPAPVRSRKLFGMGKWW